jgi:hypothetical protein
MQRALWVLVCLAFPISVLAAEAPFDRDGVVKLLGYDPEQPISGQCATRTNTARVVSLALTKETAAEAKVATYLTVAGITGIARAACSADDAPESLTPFVKSGEALSASVCLAAASAAQDKITVHISEMMNTESPDLVAGYAEGVATALEPIRDACSADNTTWAKVATQVLLINNRAVSIRAAKSCLLWRLAVEKELKAAKDIGENKGKTAGLKRLNQQAGAALFGAQHYCGEDSTAGLVNANFTLTKMMIDSMPEK